MKKRDASFIFVVITLFLAVIGFGIVIPVIPFIIAQYVPNADSSQVAFLVGALASSYAICQFFAAPVLGTLSDRYGRRPVLLLCQLGSAIGYFLFGIGGSIAILFIGRIIDGLTGGDIGTIFAYTADVTKPEERGKKFGIMGAVVGFGFMIGPSIGGVLSTIHLYLPFYAAGIVTLLNMAFGYFILPESLKKENRIKKIEAKELNPIAQLVKALKKPALRVIFLVSFFYFFPFAQLQGISSVYYKDALAWDASKIGVLFLILGIFDMITQGYLTGKLLPKLGEMKMLLLGFLLTGISYAINSSLPYFPLNSVIYIGTIIYSIGSGFFEPSIGALTSRAAGPEEQGLIQGASQSMQAITRIIGPFAAALLYKVGINVPFISNVVYSAIGFILLLSVKDVIRKRLVSREHSHKF